MTLNKHISGYNDRYPETVTALLQDAYDGAFKSVGDSTEELEKFKSEAAKIMEERKFTFHK